jgi:NAD(P)-dependent dehydrogenase (short-subunit alcohol dehydrogenase family)
VEAAAIAHGADQGAENVNLERVVEVFDTNSLGAWRMCKEFISLVKKAEHPRIVGGSSELLSPSKVCVSS